LKKRSDQDTLPRKEEKTADIEKKKMDRPLKKRKKKRGRSYFERGWGKRKRSLPAGGKKGTPSATYERGSLRGKKKVDQRTKKEKKETRSSEGEKKSKF